MTIWKYPIIFDDRFSIHMPLSAKILAVQTQDEKPYLWAMVDPSEEKVWRRFRLAGTGHPINEPVDYIGTFQLLDGGLVFHLFEIEE